MHVSGLVMQYRPDEIGHGSADCHHGNLQVRHGVTVLALLVQDDQLAHLLGHRLQDTFYRLCVKDRHDGKCFSPHYIQEEGKKDRPPAPKKSTFLYFLLTTRTETIRSLFLPLDGFTLRERRDSTTTTMNSPCNQPST